MSYFRLAGQLSNFGAVRLIHFWLVSAYFLSHNTIYSTSRTLFTGSAEQPLCVCRLSRARKVHVHACCHPGLHGREGKAPCNFARYESVASPSTAAESNGSYLPYPSRPLHLNTKCSELYHNNPSEVLVMCFSRSSEDVRVRCLVANHVVRMGDSGWA